MSKKISPILFRNYFNLISNKWVDTTFYKTNIILSEEINKIIKNFFNSLNFSVFTRIHKHEADSKNNILFEIDILFNHSFKKFYKLNIKKKLLLKKIIEQRLNTILKNKSVVILKFIKKTSKNIFKNLINYIGTQIKKKIKIKIIFDTFFKFINNPLYFYGAKLEISGRLGGIEKARTVFKNIGALKLQTVSSKIVFLTKAITTKDGIVNIKMWICIK